MLHLIMENPVRFILALIIGIATAWWIWGRLSGDGDEGSGDWDAGSDGPAAPPPSPPSPPPPPEPEAAELQPEPAGEVAAAGAASGAAAVAAAAASVPSIDGPNIAAAVGEPDDLTRIKGIGPKLNDLCHSLGVLRFDQIAHWSAADVAEVDKYLKIKGRIDRDEWVAQAKLLAAGDDEGHKAKYG